MKTIIFITGVSTVGKSSLAHILGSKLFMPRNFAIPLTIANPRKVSLRHTAAALTSSGMTNLLFFKL